VDALPGRRVRLIEVGVARSAAEDDPAARLRAIGDVVEEWLDRHAPDAVAVERVFAQHNVRTVMGTAQVSGVVMVAAARRGIPVTLHTPSEVKAAVTGSGRAGKAQVTSMVTRILDLDARPTPADAADALALAICHLWRPAAAAVTGGSSAGAGAGAGGGHGPRRGGTPAQRAWAAAEAAARRSGA
jgi:crossover junction endodeoxyribonuclease RuvC